VRTSLVLVLALLLLASCAMERAVRTEPLPEEPEGSFDVFFLGGNIPEGPGAVILDVRDDPVQFEPAWPGLSYREQEALDAGEAVRQAGEFLRRGGRGSSFRMRRIVDEDDITIGFELKTGPDPYLQPVPNLLRIRYRKAGSDRVEFDVQGLPLMERAP
jgi:hypothetical protein